MGYKARGLSHPDVVKVVDTIVDNVCDSLDLSALDSSFRSSTMSDLEDADVSDLMTSMLDEVETNENQQQLVQWCIEALQLINRRFSNHHKSLFWLIKIYFRFTPLKVIIIPQWL